MTDDTTKAERRADPQGRMQAIVMHAVSAMLDHCGNSYANKYTEEWLTAAKTIGAYHGPVIGLIDDIKTEWECWLDENGGLPDLGA